MGANSKISWCDHTWNPWYGCPDDGQRSPACDHCYARRWAKRCGMVDFDREIKTASAVTIKAPLNSNKFKAGDKVFVCSLSDFFHPMVKPKWFEYAMEMMIYRDDLTFILLTKRPEIAREIFSPKYPPLKNIWLGVTCENQEQADKRIPELLKIPAAVRFVSIEPMLSEMKISKYLGETVAVCKECGIVESMIERGPEDSSEICEHCGLSVDFIGGIDWVIVGGESGPKARPMHPDWVRSSRDQCQAAGVPFFFKQWGEWSPVPHIAGAAYEYQKMQPQRLIALDDHTLMERIGKPRAGHMIDGREWAEMPKA